MVDMRKKRLDKWFPFRFKLVEKDDSIMEWNAFHGHDKHTHSSPLEKHTRRGTCKPPPHSFRFFFFFTHTVSQDHRHSDRCSRWNPIFCHQDIESCTGPGGHNPNLFVISVYRPVRVLNSFFVPLLRMINLVSLKLFVYCCH